MGPKEGLREATVVEVTAKTARVTAAGESLRCPIRGGIRRQSAGAVSLIAVGDRVLLRFARGGQPVVDSVLPRATTLSRGAVGADGRSVEQVIAANMDQVCIVSSSQDPPFRPGFIDRVLVSARQGGLQPVLVINKIDLLGLEGVPEARVYAEIGVPVVATSALKGDGIEELREALRGRSTVLCGFSGAGKSSLLNRLIPGLDLKTGDIIHRSGRGRHITTGGRLIELPNNGVVVDTPGVNEWKLLGMAPGDLVAAFPEIASFTSQCRFSDCRHAAEPDCAVHEAVSAGRIASFRHDTYLKLLSEIS